MKPEDGSGVFCHPKRPWRHRKLPPGRRMLQGRLLTRLAQTGTGLDSHLERPTPTDTCNSKERRAVRYVKMPEVKPKNSRRIMRRVRRQLAFRKTKMVCISLSPTCRPVRLGRTQCHQNCASSKGGEGMTEARLNDGAEHHWLWFSYLTHSVIGICCRS